MLQQNPEFVGLTFWYWLSQVVWKLAVKMSVVAVRLYAGAIPNVSLCCVAPRAGSGVVRIDPLLFLAGCRTRRLNQV